MAPPAPIESLISVVPDSRLGPDVFVNRESLASHGGGPNAFGGSLLAQAISAATATIPAEFNVHSSQSAFLQLPNFKDKVVYKVERTHDGRAYSTRTVRATQGSASIYTALISYQNSVAPTGNVLQYAMPMPDLGGSHPDKDDLMDYRKFLTGLFDRSKPRWQLGADDAPLDWRFLGIEQPSEDPTHLRIRTFARSAPMSTDSPLSHLTALAYLSDEFSYAPAVAANLNATGKTMGNIAMAASLNHNIWFHDHRARVDDWLVIERETSWGDGGRVLLHQRVWNAQSGKLVLSCTQEALIRLGKPKL